MDPRKLLAAVSLIAVAGLVGCEDVARTRLDYSNTEKVAIKEIVIEPGSGDVTVSTSETQQVDIRRVVRYSGDEPDTSYHINGAVLQLATECGRFCTVDYEIVAPKGVAIRGELGSGDLSLNGVSTVDLRNGSGNVGITEASGKVKVQTGSGDMTIADVAGELDARTGSGNIDARGLSGPMNTARTGSGDVTLSLDKSGAVRTHTGSGNVDLAVPAGSYRVDARTGSGDKTLGVTSSPTGTFLLDLETGSGDITLREV
jgi:DUF4097 and DUF4098 domain-containing protein YvlB